MALRHLEATPCAAGAALDREEANREFFARVTPEKLGAAWKAYVKREFKKMKR